MNKLEIELLESQLLRFKQKQLPMNGSFKDRSLGINMILLVQRYVDSELKKGWRNSETVNQIRTFVNDSLLDTFFMMSEIEKEVIDNKSLNN